MKKHKTLKYILLLLITFSISSCESQVDKENEKLESLIFEKGIEINKNYLKCKSDIANSGLATLLSVTRLKEDKKIN